MTTPVVDEVRHKTLQDYRKKLTEHAEVEGRLRESKSIALSASYKNGGTDCMNMENEN